MKYLHQISTTIGPYTVISQIEVYSIEEETYLVRSRYDGPRTRSHTPLGCPSMFTAGPDIDAPVTSISGLQTAKIELARHHDLVTSVVRQHDRSWSDRVLRADAHATSVYAPDDDHADD